MSSIMKIKKKIDSIEATEKLTRTMKLVATANLKKNQSFFNSIKEYNKEFYNLYGLLNKEIENKKKLANKEKKVLWIVFTSTMGLCGGYNINLIKKLEANLDIKNDKILLFGKKGFNLLKNKGLETKIKYFINASNKDITYDFCSLLSEKVIESIDSEEFTTVKIIYNKFINSLEFEPYILDIHPLDEKIFKDLSKNKISGYISFESPPEEILAKIQKQFFSVVIFGCLVETNVSENSSRRNAMESATKNAKDIKENYFIEYNSKRQSKITQEINEIIGGFNASK
ncbi:MAG: ATP synthase F1 subunit gamma [Mycoplasmoidaceae bacterium]